MLSNGMELCDGLLFIGEKLIVPRYKALRKSLFRIAYNELDHFGADKTYASLCYLYYWLNMQQDLVNRYISLCMDCQRNKSKTKKLIGLLHPLPIPEH